MNSKKENKLVKWFSELNNKDVPIAGGKGASLAEMANNGFPIPPGFIITAQAYDYFIQKSNLDDKIKDIIGNVDVNNTNELNQASKKIRDLIESSNIPKDLKDEIIENYSILDIDKKNMNVAGESALEILKTSHEPPFVAVRSSATTEDLADASFAGQQDTFLNVKGNNDLLDKVKKCFSSLFTARAIYYRTKKGFKYNQAHLSVVVQKMVDSEKSGVIFSKNPLINNNSIVIEAVWGLGEGIVSGKIKPDHYVIDGNIDEFKILKLEINEKKIAIVRNSGGKNEIVKLTKERGNRQVLTSYEIKRLSQFAKQLEEYYSKPQDIEFAIESNEIYIVQSRPITTKAKEEVLGEIKGKIILSGLGASPGISSGIVRIISSMDDLDKIKKGDILVTKMTNPDMVVTMQRSSGIITDEGGVTSHAAIVSREMGIPAIVGSVIATTKLKDGEIITVDGNNGKVYEGRTEIQSSEIKPIIDTKTKIKVIVDLPDFAQRAAKSGSKSIGLTRLEGIIAASGKHPMKYIKEGKMEDYIKILVNGLKKILGPFEEIWIRSSDIRSDEYRHLEGAFKEVEGNPMLGDHGIRFSLKHIDILKAELMAVKEIADDFPNKKIGFMAPQIISVDELRKMKLIANNVMVPKNVRIGIMVETPAAVQIINDLCEEGISFISFGTNDLTQYTLAIDRNNSDVQNIYNEMNPAVLNSIAYVIRRCKRYGVETSICGQAGSREDMARFLIKQGISSISVNADSAYRVSKVVYEAEKEIQENPDKSYLNKSKNKFYKRDKIKEGFNYREKNKHQDTNSSIYNSNYSDKIQNNIKDIEDVIIKELEENETNKEEVPKLNDAIPIESEDLINDKKNNEIDLTDLFQKKDELKEEWDGESN